MCQWAIFLETVTSNCVCWIFSHLLDGGSEVGWQDIDPHSFLSFMASLWCITFDGVDNNNKKYVGIGTDSTKDMIDE